MACYEWMLQFLDLFIWVHSLLLTKVQVPSLCINNPLSFCVSLDIPYYNYDLIILSLKISQLVIEDDSILLFLQQQQLPSPLLYVSDPSIYQLRYESMLQQKYT